MEDFGMVVLFLFIIVIFGSIVSIMGYQVYKINSDKNFCENKGYERISDETDSLISCCNKTSIINEDGSFIKTCEAFHK